MFTKRSRAAWLAVVLVIVLALALAACGGGDDGTAETGDGSTAGGGGETIKVGVVTPLSGPGAILGQGTLACAELWAQQTNDAGGLLGKQVELLVQDSVTDPKTANEKAKVVVGDGADVVCGPIYDTERTAVKQVVCSAGTILLYGTYYEGGDYDDLMFVTGSTPEQAVDEFVPWLIKEYGDTFYFVGSDYSYPRVVNGMAKDILEASGGKSVGEEYAALGTTDFSAMLTRIAKAKPDLVFGNIVGTDAIAFMKQFYDYGLSKSITMYEPIDQSFVPAIGVEQCENVAVCQGWFETIGTPEDDAFVEAFKASEPEIAPVDISVSTYIALQMWAAAVEKAGTTDSEKVRKALEGLTLTDTPAGEITMRANDHHSIRHMYIAVCHDGTFEVVEDLGLIEPGEDQRNKTASE
jgi:ABC-type branched-subunit amino acid transport system substrate-binding protein